MKEKKGMKPKLIKRSLVKKEGDAVSRSSTTRRETETDKVEAINLKKAKAPQVIHSNE